jgi:hypothetical protein
VALLRNPIVKWATRFAQRLRFPHLFLLTAGLFLLDLVIPDVIPFVDEILLGFGALLLANLRVRKSDDGDPAAVSGERRRT